MPELPDVTVYVEALQQRIVGQTLLRVRLASPFLLRTVEPAVAEFEGKDVLDVRRVGKRIVIDVADELFIVIDLMSAGRFKWLPSGSKIPAKLGLAAFDFSNGTLLLTEAGSKRRASLHLVRGEAGVKALDPGGVEVLDIDLETFRSLMTRERHTLKRTLTDPHLFSGIGNAYSDEILHRAKLSPIQMSTNLSDEQMARLFEATRSTLIDWTQRLRDEAGGAFPEQGTAVREGMAGHGRDHKPRPVCGAPAHATGHAQDETNYCPRCQ